MLNVGKSPPPPAFMFANAHKSWGCEESADGGFVGPVAEKWSNFHQNNLNLKFPSGQFKLKISIRAI